MKRKGKKKKKEKKRKKKEKKKANASTQKEIHNNIVVWGCPKYICFLRKTVPSVEIFANTPAKCQGRDSYISMGKPIQGRRYRKFLPRASTDFDTDFWT
ncbi:hypothetical protein CEXT_2801 [Caerostris extrusa]|uniref:Uncharacterized protein n=1 Tax=Caerostris extrusa TaxID=172846 RepID=A0AAV4QZ63_CAEEX|nr:hypothetical protein CEXT_2801 [Caerostris extrusa]